MLPLRALAIAADAPDTPCGANHHHDIKHTANMTVLLQPMLTVLKLLAYSHVWTGEHVCMCIITCRVPALLTVDSSANGKN